MNSFGAVDNLAYRYTEGGIGNRLESVYDRSHKDYGFIDSATDGVDYRYDANGNMIMDRNKGIGTPTQNGISYNHLNLPTQVAVGINSMINYVYDATGIKLEKQLDQPGNFEVTQYAGNYIYKDNQLEFFNHPEGYVKPTNSSWRYVYQYKDHLDNIRLAYTEDPSNPGQPTIIEENNYYPFGLEHRGYNIGGDTALGNDVAQRWKFGGKEFQDKLNLAWYDISARNYDPALGRWFNIDPLAEEMRRHSPYNYAFNNPLRYVDPDGMAPLDWVLLGNGRLVYDSRVTNQKSAVSLYGSDAQHKKPGTTLYTRLGEAYLLGYGAIKSMSDGSKIKYPDQAKANKSKEGKITRDGLTVYGNNGADPKAGDGIVTGQDRGNGGSVSITGDDINPVNTLLAKIFSLPDNLTNVISIDVNLSDEALLIEFKSNNTHGFKYYGGDTNVVSISSSNQPSKDSTRIMQTTQKKQYRTSGTIGTDSLRVIRKK